MIWATRGGIVVGLTLLGMQLVAWWPGYKAFRKKPLPYLTVLAPFLGAWAYGALGVLCTLGLIGWAFDTVLWASNWLGDAALYLGVGQKAGVSSRGTYLPLTADGSGLMVILTGVFIALLKKSAYNSDMKKGAWCGACLGTASGVAGLAAVPLAQGANQVGFYLFGWIG